MLPEADWRELLRWILRRRRRVRITNRSMLPLLAPGDELLIEPGRFAPRIGDIVVLYHPLQPDLKIIKAIERVEGDRVFVAGLNPAASTDSRHFGPVPTSALLGRATSRF